MSIIWAMLGFGLRLNLEKNFKGGSVPPPPTIFLQTNMSSSSSEWFFLA